MIETDYSEALEFLYGFVDYEKDSSWKYNDSSFNLGRMHNLLARLDNPHEKCRFIHIAGTNGKGSVASMTAYALTSCGFKTGLYTSPHLVTFRERIRINDEKISKKDVIKSVELIRQAVTGIEGLTFFEVWTSLAFLYFALNSVDYAVIEVGMGGRLDSTNVITPLVSVITSVSMDHKGKLGNTIREIAYEKAGIIKKGVPVVSAPQDNCVGEVIKEVAERAGSPLIIVGRDTEFPPKGNNRIDYSGLVWEIKDLNIPLQGRFQYENTATALTVLEILSSSEPKILKDKAIEGIQKVHWPGRLQKISTNPEIIVDGACNVSAMESVRDYLIERGNPKTVAVFGICVDKNVRDVLEILKPVVSAFVFTTAHNPRALSVEKIAESAPDGIEYYSDRESYRALGKGVALAGENGLVVVTGSLYLVGEIFSYFGILENDFPVITI